MVGLGRVSGSQNTTPRVCPPVLDWPLPTPERMEDCETPVDGARSINEAADGVAVCKMGLLI